MLSLGCMDMYSMRVKQKIRPLDWKEVWLWRLRRTEFYLPKGMVVNLEKTSGY